MSFIGEFTLTNTGDLPVTVTAITGSVALASTFPEVPFTVPFGGSQVVAVQSAVALSAEDVTLTTNCAESPSVVVPFPAACCDDPVTIEETPYSLVHFGNKVTEGVATSLEVVPDVSPNLSTPESPWTVIGTGLFSTSEISFGVSCAASVSIEFDTTRGGTDSIDWTVDINVYLNGALYEYVQLISMGDSSATIDVDVSNVDCGNVITITYETIVLDGGAEVVEVTTEILSVT
jgi:hypothetical protein